MDPDKSKYYSGTNKCYPLNRLVLKEVIVSTIYNFRFGIRQCVIRLEIRFTFEPDSEKTELNVMCIKCRPRLACAVRTY